MLSLDKAMDKVFATASSWKFAMQDLAEKLQQMLGSGDVGEPLVSSIFFLISYRLDYPLVNKHRP